MDLTPVHVASKRKIGVLKGKSVYELVTTGGFHLVVIAKAASDAEIIGSGPHGAVARHIARKANPELEITELSKSEDIDEACFRHLLPEYEALTQRLRSL